MCYDRNPMECFFFLEFYYKTDEPRFPHMKKNTKIEQNFVCIADWSLPEHTPMKTYNRNHRIDILVELMKLLVPYNIH